MFLHIVDRELIHLFSGPGIILAITFIVAMIQRHKHFSWLPTRPLPTVMFSSLCVLPVAFLREPADVAAGDWVGKSYIDATFWVITCILTPWVLVRLHKWWDEVE